VTGIGAEVAQEAAEALGGERSLRDPSAAVEIPELVVDPAVGEQRGRRERKGEVGKGPAERDALRAVEVEERVVEVEEDGAEAGQGLVGAARGHFAR
jgi:hypothetical protein